MSVAAPRRALASAGGTLAGGRQFEHIAGLDIDCDVLSQSSSEFTTTATAIETASGEVASSWQGLAAFYSAPEAPQLLEAMLPAGTDAAAYVTLLRGFASSVQTLSDTVGPHVRRLREVKAEAERFVSDVSGVVTVWPWDEDHPRRTDGPQEATQ